MQKPYPQLLRPLSLAAVLLLGASIPRLAAQSYDFNTQSDSAWTHYDLNSGNPAYPPNTYSFPTNTAGPAGNYAYRLQVPVYTSDPEHYIYPRGGTFLTSASYGDINAGGRFMVGADLIAWNNTWADMEIGIAWDAVQPISLVYPSAYLVGWGPEQQTLGIASIIGAAPGIIGMVDPYSTVLQTNHQYRIVVSSFDGQTFLAQLFDLAQPNSPWQSVITRDSTLGNLGGGTVGLMGAVLLETGITSTNTEGVDATFDNFAVSAPGFVDPGGSVLSIMPATVTDVYPAPAAQASEFYPTVKIGFLNRDTSVNSSSNPNNWVKLYMDGVQVPNNQLTIDANYVYRPHNNDAPGGFVGPQSPYPIQFDGATVTYSNGVLYPWGTKHTNVVVFEDDQQISGQYVLHTNTWTWTTAYPILFASNSLPLGSLSLRGFEVRTVQSSNGAVTLDNSLARARQQLAIPPQIPIDNSATSIVQVLNWNKESAPPNNVPGLCQGTQAGLINIAAEYFAYLELTAGIHRFRINTDDRSGLYLGASFRDPNAVAIWENTDPTAYTTFDFAVQADGLYPVSGLWEETGGGAVLSLYSVDPSGVLSDTLINDPANPAGLVKAYYPLVCKSASSLNGAYSVASTTTNVVNTAEIVGSTCGPTVVGQMVTSGTITIPISSAKQFYRLDGPRRTKITNITKSGSNVVVNYQVY